MKGNFYVVYIKPNSDASTDTIKDAMNKALDWYKIKDDFWILYTTSNAEKLYGRLEPSIGKKGRVFIAKLDLSDRQGWMAKGFWEWVRKERE